MRLRPYLILTSLWLLYFHPLVLHPASTLYAPYSDLLAEHLPAKLFLAREWRDTGELPLWNPHHFCGSPLLHDIQVGAFYLPYAVMYAVPERALGAALSWVIALHCLAAGCFAYLYARSHRLNEPGSLVAAVGFMLSSKWLTHLLLAGHTITVGLAWLPLLLLLLERALARRSAGPVLGAGVALALLILGTHPQFALYAGVFAVAWTLPTRADLRRWVACWAVAGVLALLLTAVQLLPTAEAGRYSARSSGLEASGALDVGLPTALRLLGPSLSYSPPHSWEMQGVFGVFWLAAAVAAPVLAGGRARWQFGVLCGLVVFAVGGAALVDWLPGFNLFRVPTRMLLIAAFPLAYLAGAATHALVESNWSLDARAALARGFRRVALVVGMPTIVGLWFADGEVRWAFVAYWAAVVAVLPLFVRVLQNQMANNRARTALWLVILVVDLVAPVAVLPAVKPQAELFPSSPALDHLKAQPQPVRVMDTDVSDGHGQASVLGVGAPQAMVHGVGTPRGYNPLDVRHYREFLAFAVNDPGPLHGNSPWTQQVIPNFEVENPHLFALLGVTHHLAPANAPPPPGAWKVVLTDPAPPAVAPLMPRASPTLPPHTLLEAARPQPRAWIVPRAEPIGADRLNALRACDFAHTVLVEGDDSLPQPGGTKPGAARVGESRANRVTLELDGTPGWLVLSDVWFPGWTCRVDGVEVPVYRANHAFRAVPVPAGAQRAEFRFAPLSYRIGWWISVTALGLVAVFGALYARRVLTG